MTRCFLPAVLVCEDQEELSEEFPPLSFLPSVNKDFLFDSFREPVLGKHKPLLTFHLEVEIPTYFLHHSSSFPLSSCVLCFLPSTVRERDLKRKYLHTVIG